MGLQKGGVSDQFLGRRRWSALGEGFGSHTSEAPRPETPCHVESAPSCRATRLDRASPIRGCGTPVATAPPRTVSRLQPFVATDPEDVLRPCVGEGATPVCGRGWWVGRVGVAVGLVYGITLTKSGWRVWRLWGAEVRPNCHS